LWDNGISIDGQKRLRGRFKSPIGSSEYISRLERSRRIFAEWQPRYDLGLAGAMKLTHFSEPFGLDIQMHVCS